MLLLWCQFPLLVSCLPQHPFSKFIFTYIGEGSFISWWESENSWIAHFQWCPSSDCTSCRCNSVLERSVCSVLGQMSSQLKLIFYAAGMRRKLAAAAVVQKKTGVNRGVLPSLCPRTLRNYTLRGWSCSHADCASWIPA